VQSLDTRFDEYLVGCLAGVFLLVVSTVLSSVSIGLSDWFTITDTKPFDHVRHEIGILGICSGPGRLSLSCTECSHCCDLCIASAVTWFDVCPLPRYSDASIPGFSQSLLAQGRAALAFYVMGIVFGGLVLLGFIGSCCMTVTVKNKLRKPTVVLITAGCKPAELLMA
jgi:hypothetical protein